MSEQTTPSAPSLFDRLPRRLPRLGWWWLALAGVAAALAYYPVGMALTNVIDDDPAFAAPAVPAQSSRAVAMASALVNREVDVHPWVANDPFFQPGWALDDMPNFQMGIVAAAARIAAALTDDAGMAGPDAELVRAAGLLKYPGRVWKFDPRTSWAPTASAEKQYRNARRSLDSFNEHLAVGTATLARGPEGLAVLLDAVARDLDDTAAGFDTHLANGGWALLDGSADDLLFAAKGRAYAYALILRELGQDVAPTLAARHLDAAWERALDTLRRAGAVRPLVVLSAPPDALLPSHLAAQGFLIARARAQLAELAALLRKPLA